MHWPTYRSSVQQHVNRQSTDMAIKSRSTYWPIVPNRTRLRGAQIMQDPRFVQIVNANPGRNVTSPEFWVPVAQIMDQPVCPCKW